MPRLRRRLFVQPVPAAIVALATALASAPAGAGLILSQPVRVDATLVPMDGLALVATNSATANGTFYTDFVSNPRQQFTTNVTKNLANDTVNPASTTHVYTLTDVNGTTGRAAHSL